MRRWLLTRRPVLLWRGLTARRDTPNLSRLAGETDPESFVWSILPHAARSFAASIVALPRRKARAAAVAYLYCRMLDTYEDLNPDGEERITALRRFGSRLAGDAPTRPSPIGDTLATDDRDRLHLLLVAKCELVDRVYRSLPDEQRVAIARLVEDMSGGMAWSTATFARQGGVLQGQEQVVRYCHNVIGHPALFALRLLTGREPDAPTTRDAFRVSEMVQLANITRDIEKDLERGIAYHTALQPFTNGRGEERDRSPAIRLVREELLELALSRVPSYVRLFEESNVRRSPAARAAAVMMLSFTDLHYRKCMQQTGRRPWRGARGSFSVVLRASPALVSTRAARRAIQGIERRFLTAADQLREDRLSRDQTASA
jgi:phytoene/squalene synthetase